MHALLRLLCLVSLLACLACAAPANHHLHKRGSFSVERVRNPRFTGHNGPRQLLKAHRKYGVRPPQGLLDLLNEQEATRRASRKGHKGGNGNNAGTAQPDNAGGATPAGQVTAGTSSNGTTGAGPAAAGVGSVANTPTAGDVEYLAPVTIGGQTLNLDFDTGSSDLWVFNTQLDQSQTSGQTLFDPTQSSTFALLRGASFFVSYGDGSQVAGNVGTDTVAIGGATATQQAVELATAVSASFVQDTSSDGLLGLAFSTLNTVQPAQQKTFFDNVKADLAQPVFTADLRHDTPGTYTFGAVDATRFTGDLATVAVNTTQGFWQFASTQFAVGDAATAALQTGSATGQAIADTGTTLLLANAAITAAYYAAVPGAQNDAQAGGFTVPCDAALPDLQLAVGTDGAVATVRGADILFEQVQGNTCFGGLQSIDGDLMIFGDVFFKSNFVVFDAGSNTLSFAAHA